MMILVLRLVFQPSPHLQVRRSNVLFKFPALNILVLPLSPVKTANFESHYVKLQADSNYLLSDEYEVSLDEHLCSLVSVSLLLKPLLSTSEP